MYYIKQKKSKHVFLRGQIDIKPQLVDLNYLLRPNIEAGWGRGETCVRMAATLTCTKV